MGLGHARYGSIIRGNDTDGLHGYIRAIADGGTGVDQVTPGVRSGTGTRQAQAAGYPGAVRGAVNPLHGSNNPQLAKTWHIIGVDMLSMLHTPAQVLATDTGFFPDALVDIQSFTIGTGADGVGINLKTMGDGNFSGALNLADGLKHQPCGVGHILVGRQQPGPVSTQGTVNLAFDGPHRKKIVALRQLQVIRQLRCHGVIGLTPHHHIQAHGQLTLGFHAAHKINGGKRRTGILE